MEWQIVGEDANLSWVLVLSIPAVMFLLFFVGGSLFIGGYMIGFHEKSRLPFQKKKVHRLRRWKENDK